MSLQHPSDPARLSSATALPDTYLLEEQAQILQLTGQGASITVLLHHIAHWLEKQGRGQFRTAIGLTDNFGQYLDSIHAPGLPEAFSKQLAGKSYETVAHYPTGECTTASNYAQHPWWQTMTPYLQAAGIQAASIFPLIARDKQPVGVLLLFYHESCLPADSEKAVVAVALQMILLALAQSRHDTINQQLVAREKIAREEVNKAERMAQLALEGAGAGTFNINLTDNYIEYSPLLSKILTGQYIPGLTRNMLVDNIHPADRSIRDEAYLAAASTGQLKYQARFIWQDGSIHWIKAMGTYLPDAAGKNAHFAGIVLDITPEMKAQEEQQKLLAIVENSADYMGIADKEGHLLYLNKAGRALVGIDPSTDISTLVNKDFVTPEEFEWARTHIHPHVAATGTWSGTMRLRHFKTGEQIPCHADYTAIHDPLTNEYLGRGVTMRDLRPELAARQALQESEQRFRSMVEKAPVAMGIFKGEELIVEVANDELLTIWGKDARVIGLRFEEALPEIKDQPFPALMREVMETGKAHYGFETLARLYRQGKLEDCYFNFVYAPFRSGNVITGVQVVASEVTGQVYAKKALEASEERFRNFVHSAPVPIALYTGREMRIQIANEAVLATWNRDASVIGKTFLEALPELTDTPWLGTLQQVYDTGIPFTATEERVDLLHHGRLQLFYFNFTYKPLYDGQGNIYGVINTAADVTSLVLARQQLLQTQGQLHSAIESAQMATWRLDLVANKVYSSPRLRFWYGIQKEVEDLSLLVEAIHPADRERVMQLLETAIANGAREYSDEYRVRNLQQPREFIVRVTARIHRNERNEAYELTGVTLDITDQKLMEQKLEQLVQQRTEELSLANQSLKQSNEELEQFAYVASHDLQEPLRKIRIFSGMLMSQLEVEPGHHSSSKLLAKVLASAERMSQLILDLLNYSHITKKDELFAPVDLNLVLRQVLEDFELLIRQKQAILQVGALPVIDAIPLQMNQLFYNLVGNALKFTHPDRTPQIQVEAHIANREEIAHYAGHAGHEYWLITVTDNGIGFEPAMAKLIFTIFQRLHPKNRYEGTGIGLALCKRIVLAHDGAIEARSTPGDGAVFTILLPGKRG